MRGSASGYVIVSPTDDPRVVWAQDFGSGRATNLGKYTLVARALIELDTLAVRDGSFTLMAADGDSIQGTYAGQGTREDEPGVIGYEVSGLVTGGTGRFGGATGRLTFAGSADLATGEFRETVTGTLVIPDIERVEEAEGDGR